MPRGVYVRTEAHRRANRTKELRFGKTYEEIYGIEKATQMRKARKGNKNALGCKQSPEARENHRKDTKKRWQDPIWKEKQLVAMLRGSHIKPTRPELQLGNLLDKLFPGEYRYVGNGEVIIAGKNPDFININSKKKLIELFGDYWHKGENPQVRIDVFKLYGYDTLVVWERELVDEGGLKKRLVKFHKT